MKDQARKIGLAMYQPDQPGNLGAALRLGACLGIALHIIEPCGFPLDDRRMRRAGMDYMANAEQVRHADFETFERWRRAASRRLILLSTQARLAHHHATFRDGDILLVGSESTGAPQAVHARADLRVRVAMVAGARSLNVVVAAAIVTGEALRQLGTFDQMPKPDLDRNV